MDSKSLSLSLGLLLVVLVLVELTQLEENATQAGGVDQLKDGRERVTAEEVGGVWVCGQRLANLIWTWLTLS